MYDQGSRNRKVINKYLADKDWSCKWAGSQVVTHTPHFYPGPPIHGGVYKNADLLTPKQMLENEMNALDSAEMFEISRERATSQEKALWKRNEQYAAKLANVHLYGYDQEFYEHSRFASLDATRRKIARDDEHEQDILRERLSREQAEPKTRKNLEAFGYSAYQHQRECQPHQSEKADRQTQQATIERQHAMEKYSKKDRTFLRWSLLLIIGTMLIVVRTLAHLSAYAATTFWNRYQEYDVPATLLPQERRSDEDILNAQLQHEMLPPIQNSRHASSWTRPTFGILLVFPNAMWRFVFAVAYSLWQLTKAPVLACVTFVSKNKTLSLLTALTLVVIFNPTHSHPYLAKSRTPQLNNPPPPRPIRFPPPEVLNFEILQPKPSPLAITAPGEKVPCQNAFADALVDPGFSGISWPDTEIGSSEWEAQQIDIAEAMMCGFWPDLGRKVH